jgi:hypothetical protein
MNTLSRLARFGQWFKKHLVAVAIITVATLLTAGGIIYVYLDNQQVTVEDISQPIVQEPEPEPIIYHSTLTGAVVEQESDVDKPITAVMIENSPSARPQSGLKNSGVVFEAIAEGGITRFAVLYQQEKPQLIGPVRSVRIYYVNWLTPFIPSIAHVGGSPDALAEVRNGKYRDIDQFFNAQYYWRANDRYAPHNVYTSFEKLDQLNAAKGYKTSNATSFTRVDSEKAETPTATSINVTMSSYLYNSSYAYDAKTNLYKRSLAGAPHNDREQGQISPRVVVVMKVPRNNATQKYNAIGKGQATIFQDGTVQEVTWNKASAGAQITFINSEGDPVPLARGQTWIAAIPQNGGSVSWK